jgi:hypothetical protein
LSRSEANKRARHRNSPAGQANPHLAKFCC